MNQWGRWGVGLLWVSFGVAACGQELVLPTRGQTAGSDAEPGPNDGVTGESGAPADAPVKRLPVLDDPMLSSAGGAHDGSNEPRESASRAGAAGRGGASGSQGRAGGQSTEHAGGAGGADTASATAPPAVLMFSEYVEGSARLKALELYALEGGSLEDCEIGTYFNGNSEPSRIGLHGEISQGSVLVFCSTELAKQSSVTCDDSGNLIFNGDDALALRCAGVVLDIFGDIGVDPGESWGKGATLDHTLQRRCSVTSGRTQSEPPFEVETEWSKSEKIDDFSGLGTRGCDEPVISNPEE